MSGAGLGSIGIPSATPPTPIITYAGGIAVDSLGTPLNFNVDDFNLAVLNGKLDIALTHILNQGQNLQAKNPANTSEGGLWPLIGFDGTNIGIGPETCYNTKRSQNISWSISLMSSGNRCRRCT